MSVNSNRYVKQLFTAQAMTADTSIVWFHTQGNVRNVVSIVWTGAGAPVGNFIIYQSPDGSEANMTPLNTQAAGGAAGTHNASFSKPYEYIGLKYDFTSDGIADTFTAFAQSGD